MSVIRKKASMGAEKAIDIAKTIFSVQVKVIGSDKEITKNVITNDDQRYFVSLFNLF